MARQIIKIASPTYSLLMLQTLLFVLAKTFLFALFLFVLMEPF